MTVREFGGFVDDEQKRGLEGFYQDAFQQMAANRTKVLILDLRDNGGGDDRLGTLLLSYLLDQPFVITPTSFPMPFFALEGDSARTD